MDPETTGTKVFQYNRTKTLTNLAYVLHLLQICLITAAAAAAIVVKITRQ